MTALPVLREDLSLHPGPAGKDGAPTWTLHDPVRNRFFRIGWQAFEMLVRWDRGTGGSVAAAVSAETTLTLSAEDVLELAEFLAANELIRTALSQDTERMVRRAETRRGSWITWLLHHYLFFRVPLIRPDRFLNATQHLVGWLGTRAFFLATLAALLLGLLLVHRQWDEFTATFVDTISWAGLASYLTALTGVKIVHEFAHAYTAKRLGCRVPSMGLAFMVMWPLLYTDVNEAWKLQQKKQRLSVDAAGIMAELAVAAWATLAWAFLPEGPARQAAFILATTTWISSLAINLSPFMRFDGYFIVMDAIEMPNLHQRAFAFGRWWLREFLFGLGEPQPEPCSRGRARALAAFAFGVWIYRLILFLGIAALVYHFFIKAVGVALFVVEIVWFIAMPIWSEIKAWRARKAAILERRRWRWAMGAAVAACLVLVIPWRTQISGPAVLRATDVIEVFAPFSAQIHRVMVAEGQTAAKGQVLIELATPDLVHRMDQVRARIDAQNYALQTAGLNEEFRQRSMVYREALAQAEAEQRALEAEMARLTLVAPKTGVVADLQPDLASGIWVSPRERLAILRSPNAAVIEAYLHEDDIDRIAIGQSARFFPDAPGRASASGKVIAVDRTAVSALVNPVVSSVAGGPLPARQSGESIVPEGSVYRVRVRLDEAIDAGQMLRGTLSINGEARSPLMRLVRSVAIVLVREWDA